jgi:hypothetical protein
MGWPFQFFQEAGNRVQGEAGAETHGTRSHDELSRRLRGLADVEPETQVFIHEYFESLPLAAHLLLQLRSDIVIEGQGRSHIMMLP